MAGCVTRIFLTACGVPAPLARAAGVCVSIATLDVASLAIDGADIVVAAADVVGVGADTADASFCPGANSPGYGGATVIVPQDTAYSCSVPQGAQYCPEPLSTGYCPPPPATVYCPDYSDQGGNQYLAPQDSFPPETQLGPALGDIPWGQVADTLGHVLRPPRATPATPHFDPQGRRYYFDSQGRRYFLDYQGRRCYLTPQGREYFLDHQGRPYYLDPQGFRTYDFYMDRQGRVYYVDPEERVHFFETQGRPCYLDSQGRAYYRDSLGWEFGLDPHGRPYYL